MRFALCSAVARARGFVECGGSLQQESDFFESGGSLPAESKHVQCAGARQRGIVLGKLWHRKQLFTDGFGFGHPVLRVEDFSNLNERRSLCGRMAAVLAECGGFAVAVQRAGRMLQTVFGVAESHERAGEEGRLVDESRLCNCLRKKIARSLGLVVAESRPTLLQQCFRIEHAFQAITGAVKER